ncbi:MAG: ribosome-associated translation inhibitor RaiA [Flavobacteriales bacterium]|nr:ribosome-associated translation inhibitor RaiA [Flavobacteriales bacterium]
MKVKIHSVKFDADKELHSFVTERVDKLELFYDKIVAGEVFLRIDGTSKTDDKVAEIRLTIPGKELFAKKNGKSFEEATDLAVDALRRQLKKTKQKAKSKNSLAFFA